jgi:hypothetical protein
MTEPLTGEVARNYIAAFTGARGGLNAEALSRDARAAMRGGRSALRRLRICRVWVVRFRIPPSRCRVPVTGRRGVYRPTRRRARAPDGRSQPRLPLTGEVGLCLR